MKHKIGVRQKSESLNHMPTSLAINSPPGNEDNPLCCKDTAEVQAMSREQIRGASVSQSKGPQETQYGSRSHEIKG